MINDEVQTKSLSTQLSLTTNPARLPVIGNTGNVVYTSFTDLSDSRVKTEIAKADVAELLQLFDSVGAVAPPRGPRQIFHFVPAKSSEAKPSPQVPIHVRALVLLGLVAQQLQLWAARCCWTLAACSSPSSSSSERVVEKSEVLVTVSVLEASSPCDRQRGSGDGACGCERCAGDCARRWTCTACRSGQAPSGESVSVTDLLADSLALTGSATLDGLTAQGNVGCDQLLCNNVNCTDVFTTGVDACPPTAAPARR